jgi:antitoxin component YwqK of YwqJK toxin-antitoxin module
VVSYPKGVHHPQVDAKNTEEGVQSVAEAFWRNGKQMASTPQIGMKANGRDRAWWPNGNLAREAVFALGSATGTWKFYDESGKFVGEGTYKNGKRYQGIFIGSDASGGGFFLTSYPMKLQTYSNGGFLNEGIFLKELKVE